MAVVETAQLVGAVDIADRLGTTKPNVSNWQKRYASFPAPVATVSRGTRLWLWPEVQAWAQRANLPTNERRH